MNDSMSSSTDVSVAAKIDTLIASNLIGGTRDEIEQYLAKVGPENPLAKYLGGRYPAVDGDGGYHAFAADNARLGDPAAVKNMQDLWASCLAVNTENPSAARLSLQHRLLGWHEDGTISLSDVRVLDFLTALPPFDAAQFDPSFRETASRENADFQGELQVALDDAAKVAAVAATNDAPPAPAKEPEPVAPAPPVSRSFIVPADHPVVAPKPEGATGPVPLDVVGTAGQPDTHAVIPVADVTALHQHADAASSGEPEALNRLIGFIRAFFHVRL